jgi:hypothetical protein
MDDAFEVAGRALQIGTIGHCLILILYEWRIANWTTLWEIINLLFSGTPLDNGFHYLRYYLARPLN